MNGKKIGYWVSTALVCAAMGGGGVMDLLAPPDLLEIMEGLGYPAYVLTILGFWKLGAVVTLLVPGLPRLKEWAYAGIVFDLTGATWSHMAVGDATADVVTPLVILAITAVSWRLRPAGRSL